MYDDNEYKMPFRELDKGIDQIINKYGIHMQLAAIRQRHHYTQSEVAQMCDLSTGSISRIETGKEVNLKTILKYANTFGYELVLRKKDDG